MIETEDFHIFFFSSRTFLLSLAFWLNKSQSRIGEKKCEEIIFYDKFECGRGDRSMQKSLSLVVIFDLIFTSYCHVILIFELNKLIENQGTKIKKKSFIGNARWLLKIACFVNSFMIYKIT